MIYLWEFHSVIDHRTEVIKWLTFIRWTRVYNANSIRIIQAFEFLAFNRRKARQIGNPGIRTRTSSSDHLDIPPIEVSSSVEIVSV